MDKLVSLAVSAAGIGVIIWWFFGKRQSEAREAEQVNGVQRAEIIVDGGYQPQVVQLKAGVPAQLIFDRKDPSACLEGLVMPDFGVLQTLPLDRKTTIELGPQAPGTYKYTCGMQMFSGQVVVK